MITFRQNQESYNTAGGFDVEDDIHEEIRERISEAVQKSAYLFIFLFIKLFIIFLKDVIILFTV